MTNQNVFFFLLFFFPFLLNSSLTLAETRAPDLSKVSNPEELWEMNKKIFQNLGDEEFQKLLQTRSKGNPILGHGLRYFPIFIPVLKSIVHNDQLMKEIFQFFKDGDKKKKVFVAALVFGGLLFLVGHFWMRRNSFFMKLVKRIVILLLVLSGELFIFSWSYPKFSSLILDETRKHVNLPF